jgi:undecaprenyl pyrophosphate phosphatase UppP
MRAVQGSVPLSRVLSRRKRFRELFPPSYGALVTALLTDVDPAVAVDLALFVQVGTILSASTYYREDIATALASAPDWRPSRAYDPEHADVTFVAAASAATAVVGIPVYFALREAVSGWPAAPSSRSSAACSS